MAAHRLLVLDDDEMVGKLLVMVAQRAGFEVQLCVRPQPFFAAVKEWFPSHLAIDLTMPEMSGVEVLRALAQAGCTARIIISSGSASDDAQDALDEAGKLGLRTIGVLSKPFSLRSMRALLAEVEAPGAAFGGAGAGV